MGDILRSHNDYWNQSQIHDALSVGCNMIETDVIMHRGEMYNTHSWRPCACMMYGRLEDYLSFFYKYKGFPKMYFYIELKSHDEKIIDKMIQLLSQYNNPLVTYIIGGIEGKRREIAEKIYWVMKPLIDISFYPVWEKGKGIDTIYLYKKLPWYKKLNHF
jgi:hypothetical protein